jgi:hypothetical protein
MTLPSDTTLALISWLASQNSEALQNLIRWRNVPPSSCSSFRSLAEALLSEENIHTSLAQLTRQELLALQAPRGAAKKTLASLEARGFLTLTASGASLLIPASELDSLHIDPAEKPPAVPPARELAQKEISGAASQALTMVVGVSDLLDVVRDTTLPIQSAGLPTATSIKNLETLLGVGYDIPTLWGFATTAGLIGQRDGCAALTPQAFEFHEHSDATRWSTLASAWWESSPPWLKTIMSSHPGLSLAKDLETQVSYHYPVAPLAPALEQLLVAGETLGALHQGRPTPYAVALWGTGSVAKMVHKFFPPPAAGVFANDDYTLLASGPLSPAHREILGSIAHRELGGLVPRFRLTSTSVLQALQSGITAPALTSMLKKVCVNDVPSSMHSLVEDVARRSAQLTLQPHGDSTLVITTGDTMLEELLSDPGLLVLGLKPRDDHHLVCSWPAERVHSTLLGASYPALLVDATGKPSTERAPLATTPDVPLETQHQDALAGLIRSATEASAQGVPAGFQSIIEVATETKTPLEIDVTMPEGNTITIVMEPRALSAGRLRGVEIKHQVEKTLPVSRITSIRAWVGE